MTRASGSTVVRARVGGLGRLRLIQRHLLALDASAPGLAISSAQQEPRLQKTYRFEPT
jgi:hypothetical protein